MINRSFPIALQFHRAAEMHLDAATRLLALCPPKPSILAHEVIYLAGYVVECGLKAIAVSLTPRAKHGGIEEQLKEEVGHNLDRLRAFLEQRGVVFRTDMLNAHNIVRAAWKSEMRYSPMRWDLKTARSVLEAAGRVLHWTVRG